MGASDPLCAKCMWSCPHCRSPLTAEAGTALSCPTGHRFDLAREGYVNLLPPNRKSSKEPGDSREMIAARSRVHSEGLYQPLAQAIAEQARQSGGPLNTLLDMGCGEGYYSQEMLQGLSDAVLYGIDISKPAVRKAAKACKRGRFAVASAFDVPLPDGSIDLVFSVFAPVSETELLRILSPGGTYLKVVPAPRHLWELRSLLYDDPRPHSEELHCPEGFQIIARQGVAYSLDLEAGLLKDVVAMTPYAHRGQRENRDRLEELDQFQVGMDFTISLMRRNRT